MLEVLAALLVAWLIFGDDRVVPRRACYHNEPPKTKRPRDAPSGQASSKG